MKDIDNLHNEAMDLAEEAFIEEKKGNYRNAFDLYKKAFTLEKKAALLISADEKFEPTRSILLMSAASLAIDIGELREAEMLITRALSGNPPNLIAEELRDLYEQVNFKRHLELKGIKLSENSLQLSLSGQEVGFGMIQRSEYNKRAEALEILAYRNLARIKGYGFSNDKNRIKFLRKNYPIYCSMPRASSFAVTLRIGGESSQIEIFEVSISQVIDEVIDGIKLIDENKLNQLEKKIQDEDYFKNFVALTKELSPDGIRIKQVGLTAIRNGIQKNVSLIRKKSEIKYIKIEESETEENRTFFEGILTFADANQKSIKLTSNKTNTEKIVVPDHLDDIVKQFWEESVKVKCIKKGKGIYLEEIFEGND